MDEWEKIEGLTQELIDQQSKLLLNLGRRFVSSLTAEDLLQPNDYAELEYNPIFRYEEGLLAGLQTLKTALLALKRRSRSAERVHSLDVLKPRQ